MKELRCARLRVDRNDAQAVVVCLPVEFGEFDANKSARLKSYVDPVVSSLVCDEQGKLPYKHATCTDLFRAAEA
jgi:hypothetical protein